MSIIVFGSLNLDLVVQTHRLPLPGETLLGDRFMSVPGGKGANQAVAAARLGIPTTMIGRVGNDDFGQQLRQSLQQAGVDTAGVQVDEATSTGIAAIAVASGGENHIIVVPGANAQVSTAELECLRQHLSSARLLLLQLEIPMAAAEQAAAIAHQAGLSVILDPAPAPAELSQNLCDYTDILTPNQTEAAQLTGITVKDARTAEAAAKRLYQRQIQVVIIKMANQGVYCSTASQSFFLPAYPVEVVDTVAAGDAFNAGLAAALSQGKSMLEAVYQANAVAALSVTQAGAQPSLPSVTQLQAFLDTMPTLHPR
ncbi:MAG: ribokinase [Leptolyngbyaceae cyanobacterium SM1_1_3]|nr:ribokinase [Leptolyngbyaceae cyanobacterium SM1_1_3]NJN01257.1 ribokinase [Leptolyngbyaceae cyanobacterium RM1_1_2]NJO11530.1 ribokinase [Leptolyngbyaceae cyanobacterium SL_1_1]